MYVQHPHTACHDGVTDYRMSEEHPINKMQCTWDSSYKTLSLVCSPETHLLGHGEQLLLLTATQLDASRDFFRSSP